ncbi:MAG: hypothetical protein LBG88_02810 [Christensenellaceae bacterium]|jgi:hypothetical protein|nr:hypothetical protein [Christensenellaceae bacterium]
MSNEAPKPTARQGCLNNLANKVVGTTGNQIDNTNNRFARELAALECAKKDEKFDSQVAHALERIINTMSLDKPEQIKEYLTPRIESIKNADLKELLTDAFKSKLSDLGLQKEEPAKFA